MTSDGVIKDSGPAAQKIACIRLPYQIWEAKDETPVPLPPLFYLTI
jgi:hypothetical protein